MQVTLVDICTQQMIVEMLRNMGAGNLNEDRAEAGPLNDIFGNLPMSNFNDFEGFENQLSDQMAKQLVSVLFYD
jgi:hypothetical protein